MLRHNLEEKEIIMLPAIVAKFVIPAIVAGTISTSAADDGAVAKAFEAHTGKTIKVEKVYKFND